MNSILTCCHGNNVSPEEEAESSRWLVANFDIHVNLWINSTFFSWGLILQGEIMLCDCLKT